MPWTHTANRSPTPYAPVPPDEDDWTALLRRAVDTAIRRYRQDRAGAPARTRLVRETPALRARRPEQQYRWRPLLAQALAERTGASQPESPALSVKAAAALDCLDIALDHWTASDGRRDLEELLDEAFAALAAR